MHVVLGGVFRRARHFRGAIDAGCWRADIGHAAARFALRKGAAGSVRSLSPFGERVGVRGLPAIRTDPNPLSHSFTLQKRAALSPSGRGYTRALVSRSIAGCAAMVILLTGSSCPTAIAACLAPPA